MVLRNEGGPGALHSIVKRKTHGTNETWEVIMPDVGTDRRLVNVICDALNSLDAQNTELKDDAVSFLGKEPHKYSGPEIDTVGICLCRRPSSGPIHNV